MPFLIEVKAGKNKYSKAAEGNYLDRVMFLAAAFKLPKEYLTLLAAYKNVRDKHGKPQGLDDFLFEVGHMTLQRAKKEKLTHEDWENIVWGVSSNLLEKEGLLHYRSDTPNKQAANDKV